MTALPLPDRDPVKVRAGLAGAKARWQGHVPRSIRLDTLTLEQRRLVAALVEACKADSDQPKVA